MQTVRSPGHRAFTDEQIQTLSHAFGQVADYALAQQFDCHPSTIAYHRNKRGIPAYKAN